MERRTEISRSWHYYILLVAIIIATCLRTTRSRYRTQYNIPYSRRDPNDNNKYIYNTNNIMYGSRATVLRTWNRSVERFQQKSVSLYNIYLFDDVTKWCHYFFFNYKYSLLSNFNMPIIKKKKTNKILTN